MSADQQTRVGQGCRRSRQGKKNSAVCLSSNVPKLLHSFEKILCQEIKTFYEWSWCRARAPASVPYDYKFAP